MSFSFVFSCFFCCSKQKTNPFESVLFPYFISAFFLVKRSVRIFISLFSKKYCEKLFSLSIFYIFSLLP